MVTPNFSSRLELIKERISRPNRGGHWTIFLCSFVAHVALVWVIEFTPVSTRELTQDSPLSEKLISVSFIPSKTTTGASDATQEKRTVPGGEQGALHSTQAVPTEASTDFTMDTFKSPKPHYFLPRELTDKTQGSLDISPELAFQLTGEMPRSAKLRLRINEKGYVDHVIVDESNFLEVDKKLLSEFYKSKKFDAGKIDGQAVKSELSLEITIHK